MVIELIFCGHIGSVTLGFMEDLMKSSLESRSNTPFIDKISFEDVTTLFDRENYVDLAINNGNLVIENFVINKVFANVTKDAGRLEILLFFDTEYINDDNKNAIIILKTWSNKFADENSFETFICKIDNGDEDEYYFNKEGYGPLMF